jgi:hypothetical protein
VNNAAFYRFAIRRMRVKLKLTLILCDSMPKFPSIAQQLICIGASLVAMSVVAAPLSGGPIAPSTELPTSIANAPDDAWVPVMLLDGHSVGTKLLGLAQVKDIENGYPYKVGLYQLVGAAKFGSSGLSSQISVGKMTLMPVCTAAAAPRCEPLIGVLDGASQIGANARYQLGPVQLNAGIYTGDRGYTQLLNPYLPLPSSPTLTFLNGAGKQTGLNLQAALDSNLGRFGLGLDFAKTPIALASAGGFPAARSTQLNESSLNFNWLGESFGTQLSTRISELAGSRRAWGGIDLGLTWRTPWQGTLTFGAKNLVVSGKPPTYLDPERASDAVDQERVPYVRYQQDL